ncbi:MAG: biotin/lipoyl-binding protein, partial [Burkholderiales bacterium]
MNSSSPMPQTPATQNNGKRRSLLIAATLILLIVLAGCTAWWLLYGRYFESTDDAYVAGNVVQVTPQVSGTVLAINADDTDLVHMGQPLIELDRSDARVALDQAKAQLAQTVREVHTLFVNNDTLAAEVKLRASDVERAADDLKRRRALAGTGAVSREEVEHAGNALQSAESALQASREQLNANRVLTDRTSVAKHPNVQR